MVAFVTRALDYLRGGGDYAISVPPFDGPLRPNEWLEAAEIVASMPSPDNLARGDGGVYFSSERALLRLNPPGVPDLVRQWPSPITALAAHGPALAVGLESGGVRLLGGAFDGLSLDVLEDRPLNSPVALAFETPDVLLVANGSQRHSPSRWKHDLLEGGRTGSVHRVELATGRSSRLAGGLGFPYGLLPAADGSVLVSESWRHRLVRIDRNGRQSTVLGELPAYPARLAPATAGGAWLACFAPRRRIVELVLRETAYRRRMMAEIDSAYWISPSLAPMASFLESLQGGTLKKLARLKPWAPTASYGLAVRLDAQWRPVDSLHSRGDGSRHGVRSVLETPEGVLAASAGAHVVMQVAPGREA